MNTLLTNYLRESPYAENYGMQLLKTEPQIECVTPWQDDFVGNPLIHAWHGGIVTGVLELTGKLAALSSSQGEICSLLSVNVNFFRPTLGELPIKTKATLVRKGRQIINIEVLAWQDLETCPKAGASLTFARACDERLQTDS